MADELTGLRDRIELTELVHRLAASLDEHRFGDLRALFTEDATATTPGGTARGGDALVAQAARNHEPYARTHHHLAGIVVDLDGDRAAVRASQIATFVREAGTPPESAMGAVYRLTARRTPAGWRLAGLDVDVAWRLPYGQLTRAAG